MLSRECYYCQGEAKFVPIQKMAYHGINIYYCYKCNAEHLYYQSSELGSINLYTEIDGKMYRYSTSTDKLCIASLWHIKKPGVPGVKVNEGMIFLKDFSDIKMDINPSNIKEKIKSYLLFL